MSDVDTIDLRARKCQPCEGGVPPLSQDRIQELRKQVPAWSHEDGDWIGRTWKFEDFYQTMSFVNAVAWIANRENHHPDMHVGFNQCKVWFKTHAVGGLTDNDFICAAKIDGLIDEA
jgi:4a-hydroxytetrahydrobiopterin dehydratase